MSDAAMLNTRFLVSLRVGGNAPFAISSYLITLGLPKSQTQQKAGQVDLGRVELKGMQGWGMAVSSRGVTIT